MDTSGTGDLLYINQHILKECKAMGKTVAMTYIDYKIANDVIPFLERRMPKNERDTQQRNKKKTIRISW